MYTILINKDKSLTTSVKETILRNTTTDEIAILYTPESTPEPSGDTSDEETTNTTTTVTKAYTGLLRYEVDGITKVQELVPDEELYKGKVRLIVPRLSPIFNNRGRIQLWVELTIDTTITTQTIDPDTGELIDQTITNESETFTTLPTVMFIETVPRECPWHRDDNTIRITKGDSLSVGIELIDEDGYDYKPELTDTILFTVKKSALATDILIQKQIDPETLIIDFIESDTRNLAFGDYKYEVEVVTESDDHYTVIKNAPFIIMEELHE